MKTGEVKVKWHFFGQGHKYIGVPKDESEFESHWHTKNSYFCYSYVLLLLVHIFIYIIPYSFLPCTNSVVCERDRVRVRERESPLRNPDLANLSYVAVLLVCQRDREKVPVNSRVGHILHTTAAGKSLENCWRKL
jgi:hypothetical protein